MVGNPVHAREVQTILARLWCEHGAVEDGGGGQSRGRQRLFIAQRAVLLRPTGFLGALFPKLVIGHGVAKGHGGGERLLRQGDGVA